MVVDVMSTEEGRAYVYIESVKCCMQPARSSLRVYERSVEAEIGCVPLLSYQLNSFLFAQAKCGVFLKVWLF